MKLFRVARERWLPLLPDANALQARAQPSPRTRAVPGKPPRLSCSKKPVTQNMGLRLAVKRKSAEEEGKRHSAAPKDFFSTQQRLLPNKVSDSCLLWPCQNLPAGFVAAGTSGEDFEYFLVAFERRNQVGAGDLGARPVEHAPRQGKPGVARGGARGFEFRLSSFERSGSVELFSQGEFEEGAELV